MNSKLIVLEGRHQGRKIKLPRTQFVIGRDEKCHLRPASLRVSRFHCAIALRNGGLVVRDLKSQNGTFVNGRRVERASPLCDGDVLQVGWLKFRLEIAAESDILEAPDSGVKWLLEQCEKAAKDSPVSSSDTAEWDVHPEGSPPASAPADPPESDDALVAGEYLRDYAERRGLKKADD